MAIFVNPMNNITNISYVDDEENEIAINKFNISKYFKHLYVLCPMNNNINFELLNTNIQKSIFYDILESNMILYKTDIRIVKNDFHFSNLVFTESEDFTKANKFNYDLDSKILLLPVLNINFLNLKDYLDNLNENNLEDMYNLIVIHNYFGENTVDNYKNNIFLKNKISSLKESQYWINPFNCNLNFSKLFEKRRFFVKKFNSFSNDLKQFFNKLENVDIDDNYIEEIYKFKKYCDPSCTLNNNFRLYRMTDTSDFSKEDFNSLLSKLSIKNQFNLVCRLLISKKYCHLVFSENIFDPDSKLYNLIKLNFELFEYLMGYAWTTMYMEECIRKRKLNKDDRCVFTIDLASKLPVFPLDPLNPYKNPYLPLLPSTKILNPENNINGMEIKLNCKNRMCNLKEFKERLNIFIKQNKNYDIFSGIDFEEHKMAISGSVISACSQYKHPLMKLFETPSRDSIEKIIDRFFNEYYSEADIDIMIRTQDNLEFFEIADKLYNKIKTNMQLYEDEYNIPLKKTINKRLYLKVNPETIKNIFGSEQFEYIISNLDKVEVIDKFYPYFVKYHQKYVDKYFEDFSKEEIEAIKLKYPYYFNVNIKDCEIRLDNNDRNLILSQVNGNINEKSNDEITINNKEIDIDNSEESMYVLVSYKMKISSPFLDHDLEIFPVRGDDFFSVVNEFHLPCVRAYYNGTNVYGTPSWVSAHQTFMNLNYKYVAGKKDPLDIINKYRMRGFGTYLNKEEVKLFIKYVTINKFWKNLYCVDSKSIQTYKNCLGYLDINHRLFRPRLFNSDHFETENIRYIPKEDLELYNDKPHTNYNHNNDCKLYLKQRYNSLKLQSEIASINETEFEYQNKSTGNLKPVKEYIIDCVIGHISNNDKNNNTLPMPPSNVSHPENMTENPWGNSNDDWSNAANEWDNSWTSSNIDIE